MFAIGAAKRLDHAFNGGVIDKDRFAAGHYGGEHVVRALKGAAADEEAWTGHDHRVALAYGRLYPASINQPVRRSRWGRIPIDRRGGDYPVGASPRTQGTRFDRGPCVTVPITVIGSRLGIDPTAARPVTAGADRWSARISHTYAVGADRWSARAHPSRKRKNPAA